MNVVDASVLVYAVNTDASHHRASLAWLDAALSGSAMVGFAWISLLAFVRLTTKVGLFPKPLSVANAIDQVSAWLDAPAATIVEPTARHLTIVQSLLKPLGAGGNLVNDAHLAALSIEHRGTVVSFDNDFGRFPSVKWLRP